MNSTTLRSAVAIASLAVSGMALSLLPTAATAATAEQFMNGGEYCFLIGEAIPGGWLTKIKMIVSHEAGGIAHIDGLEKGTQAVNPPSSYNAPLIGVAVVAADLPEKKLLHISLQGASHGEDSETAGVTGSWVSNHGLELKLVDLTGHDTGYSTFTPIKAGQAGEPHIHAVDDAVTPIACREF